MGLSHTINAYTYAIVDAKSRNRIERISYESWYRERHHGCVDPWKIVRPTLRQQ